jgi:uncharacterized protein YjbJ (UPF0337 family)
VFEKAKDWVTGTRDSAEETAQQVKDKASGLYDQAGQTIKDKTGQVRDDSRESMEQAKDSAPGVGHKIEHAIHGLMEKLHLEPHHHDQPSVVVHFHYFSYNL